MPTDPSTALQLTSGEARCLVDPHGGRLAALRVGDLDLLLTPDDDPGGGHWGCFVMAPWAGRTRHGRFTFAGVEHRLPLNSPPHAIHGTVRQRDWTVLAASPTSVGIETDLGENWPFPGRCRQVIVLADDHVELTVSIQSDAGEMPASAGWHPWFRRHLGRGLPARLDLPAGAMYRRDEEDVATADLLRPPPLGPWDDCFTDLVGPPTLQWEGALSLAVESSCPCVVVYDHPPGAVCVEPQTAPPDALNLGPAVVTPGRPLVATTTWRWS
jgi:aldose 1-epimerase